MAGYTVNWTTDKNGDLITLIDDTDDYFEMAEWTYCNGW
jgi:hypothetical protein